MSKSIRLLALIATVALFGTSAFAQVEQASQISVQGTGLFPRTSTSDSTGTTYDTTKTGGLLVGYSYQFNRWGGVEEDYGYTRNTESFSAPTGTTLLQTDVHEVMGSFVAHVPAAIHGVRPYALVGGGALVFNPTSKYSIAGSQNQTRGAFVYGAGVNFDVTHNFGIRAEYRGLVYKIPDFNVGRLNLDKFTHLAQPSVGFFFRF